MSVYKIDSRTGITFYKPDFPFLEPDKDVGTNCGLSVAEMNNNFYLLEGRDIYSFTLEGNDLKLKLKNGTEYLVTLTNGSGGISYRSDGSILIEGDKIATSGRIIPWCTNASEDDFEVTNPVGLYKEGDMIPAKTSIEEVLKTMLTKEQLIKDVTVTLPSVKMNVIDAISGLPITDTTKLAPNTKFKVNLSYKYQDDGTLPYTQGQYSGGWLLPTNPLPAKCPELQNTRYVISNNGNVLETIPAMPNIIYENNNGFDAGSLEIKLLLDYGDHANTDTPKKSDGSESPKKIKAGTCQDLLTLNVKAELFYMYGYYPYMEEEAYILPNNKCKDVIKTPEELAELQNTGDENVHGSIGECVIGGSTEIQGSLIGNLDFPNIILALPLQQSKITKTIDALGINDPTYWRRQEHDVVYNGITYAIYVIFCTDATEYKQITFE